MLTARRKNTNYGKVISFGLQKGGVGKTTSTVLTASILAERLPHMKFLAVDNDPQGNLTTGLCTHIQDVDEISPTILDAVLGRTPLEKALIQTKNNLWVLPANTDLSSLDVFIIANDEKLGEEKFFLLKNALAKIEDQFDYIFIDLPPQLGFLTILGLIASDSVILTMQAEPWARRAVPKFIQTIQNAMEYNPDLKIAGILGTMADARTILSSTIMSSIRQTYSDLVFDTAIRKTVRLSEVSLLGVGEKAKEIQGQYNEFVDELIEKGVIKIK